MNWEGEIIIEHNGERWRLNVEAEYDYDKGDRWTQPYFSTDITHISIGNGPNILTIADPSLAYALEEIIEDKIKDP